METTSKPMIAGILIIVAGALGLLSGIADFIGFGVVSGMMGIPIGYIPPFVPGIVMGTAIVTTTISIITIVGGVFALKRSIWGLALAGAILAIFAFYPPFGLGLGIAAIVLLAQSKKEFA